MPLDLDAIQARYDTAAEDGTLEYLGNLSAGRAWNLAALLSDVPNVLAELRLAREVVEEYRNNRLHLMRNGIITLPSVTLAAYDKHLEETCHG